MDLNDYWQENKRFLTGVAVAGIVFLVGQSIIGNVYGRDLNAKKRAVGNALSDLREARFSSSQLTEAREVNERLEEVVATLSDAVQFKPRERFVYDPRRGSATNQYFDIVSTTRQELIRIARRKNVRLPETLGLPALSPTREQSIQRFLEAIDVVDRVVRLALDAGVERIDKIDIELDPGLDSSRGVGAVEMTRIKCQLSGYAHPLVKLIGMTQSDEAQAFGGPILIDDVEMRPERSKPDEAVLKITFGVCRLHGIGQDEDEE